MGHDAAGGEMTVMAVLVAVLTHRLVAPHRPRWSAAAALLAGGLVLSPLPAAAAGGLVGVGGWYRRVARRRRDERAARDDVVLLAEMVHLGLAAGLTFAASLEMAAGAVHPLLGAEARGTLRRARPGGLAPVLAGGGGMAGRLYVLAARAGVTGAPLLPAVAAFVTETRQEERSRREAEARRLPVRLLIPVALLILPGFVVLTVAPALLGAFERLRF